MSDFYDDLAETSLELLTEFGLDVMLIRKTTAVAGDYDTTTGGSAPVVPAPTEVRKGLVTDNPGNRLGQQYGNTTHDGSLVGQTEKWLYMDANGPAPNLEDSVVLQGVRYTVLDIQVTAPGGQAVLYLLVLRK